MATLFSPCVDHINSGQVNAGRTRWGRERKEHNELNRRCKFKLISIFVDQKFVVSSPCVSERFLSASEKDATIEKTSKRAGNYGNIPLSPRNSHLIDPTRARGVTCSWERSESWTRFTVDGIIKFNKFRDMLWAEPNGNYWRWKSRKSHSHTRGSREWEAVGKSIKTNFMFQFSKLALVLSTTSHTLRWCRWSFDFYEEMFKFMLLAK